MRDIPHITHWTVGYQRILDLSSSLDVIHRVRWHGTTNIISLLRAAFFSSPVQRTRNTQLRCYIHIMYVVTKWLLQASLPPRPVSRTVFLPAPRPLRRRHFGVSQWQRRQARPQFLYATQRGA